MKAAVVRKAGAPLVLEERPIPQPGSGEVRVKVQACGICHSDQFIIEALWPGLQLPRVPGHEVVGVVDAVGDGVSHTTVGRRAGIGFHGGFCGVCRACRSGDLSLCETQRFTAIAFDGGYAEYMIAPATALAFLPTGISFVDAAPMLCAGVTTFNSLRNAGARPGDVVAVQGIGGLGHLGVQFARAMGFHVVAISRGADKAAFAEQLGAHDYIDTGRESATEALTKLGGASVILATAPSASAISALVPGLGRNGCLMVLAATSEPIQVAPSDLIGKRARVQGWPSGHAQDSTETLQFAVLHNIRPMIERFPLEEANTAYQRMINGEVRFRAVLEIIPEFEDHKSKIEEGEGRREKGNALRH
jgi:propanol-preferring alcohol dehydrogenase